MKYPDCCIRCGLNTVCKSYKIPARILYQPKKKTNKRILGIFMNPGQEEDRYNKILIGKAGQLTIDMTKTHWKDYEVWATNPVKCFHNPKSDDKSKELQALWIKLCNKFLIEDILKIKPALIVLHGTVARTAYNYIFELYSKEYMHFIELKAPHRIKELEPEVNFYKRAVAYIKTIPIETTVHPASIFYGMPNHELENIYMRVSLKMRNKLKKVPYTTDLTKVLNDITKKKFFGFDTEWNPNDNKVHTIGLSTNTICTAMPFIKGLQYLKILLKDSSITCKGFNLVSDLSMLMGMGVTEFNCKFVDGLILRRELMPDIHATALKETFAYKYLLIENYWKDITKQDFIDGYSQKIARYCAGDAWTAVKTVEFLRTDFKKEYDAMKIARQIDMDMLLPVAYMHYRGIKLSKTHLSKRRIETEERMNKLHFILENEHSPTGSQMNPDSTQQVLEYLQSKGHKIKKTDKPTLQKLLVTESKSFVTSLLEYRGLKKSFSTYFNTLANGVDRDGVIHINLNIASAVTGRPTSSNPNMLNQSKQWRDCFMTKFGKDGVLKSMDGDQQEYRVYAYLSQYKELLDMYTTGHGDIHNWTQEKLGLDDRHIAKTINFAFLFGAGQWKLVQGLIETGRDEWIAKKLIAEYMAIMEPIRDYQTEVWDTVQMKGEIVSVYGRRGVKLEYTNAINFPVQAFAHDINSQRLLWMFKEMRLEKMASHIWLDFYDAVEYDCYKPEEKKLDELIEACYNELKYVPDVYGYGTQLEIPLEITRHGRYWG